MNFDVGSQQLQTSLSKPVRSAGPLLNLLCLWSLALRPYPEFLLLNLPLRFCVHKLQLVEPLVDSAAIDQILVGPNF